MPGEMFESLKRDIPKEDNFEDQPLGITRYFLERLRYLEGAGCTNDSPLVQEVMAQINGLPQEQTA